MKCTFGSMLVSGRDLEEMSSGVGLKYSVSVFSFSKILLKLSKVVASSLLKLSKVVASSLHD